MPFFPRYPNEGEEEKNRIFLYRVVGDVIVSEFFRDESRSVVIKTKIELLFVCSQILSDIMKLLLALFPLVSVASVAANYCHPADLLIGGSSDEQPLVKKWIDGYKTECPETNLILEEVPCSSSCGARRVCSEGQTYEGETPLDVGTLSRPWREMEAVSNNGFLYQCVDSQRQLVSIDAALYALSFVVGTGGAAHECIIITGGLTLDQLRWIYSNLSRAELIENGWDPDSLENDDMNDNTHLWSELDARCANEEILISGGPYMSADHQFVAVELFGDLFDSSVEDIPIDVPRNTGPDTFLEYYTSRPSSLEASASTTSSWNDSHDLLHHVKNNGAAITFVKYQLAAEYDNTISLVPIENNYGNMVYPSYSSILSQDYFPFARKMHINMVKNENTLRAMKGFFEFAYSARGSEMVEEVGYFPLAAWEQKVMLAVLDDDAETWGDITCSDGPSVMEIDGSLTAFPVAKVWSDVFRAKCNVDIKVRGGSSRRGAERVCGTSAQNKVDIGMMSRDFTSSEAVSRNGYEYECVGSSNKVVQIEAAVEAVVVVTKVGGVAEKCIGRLGGLTIPQLRWIYSSFTENQLRYEDWSFESTPNSDGDQSTHLWSELLDHPDCPATEIKISGPADDTTFIDLFADEVLPSYEDGEDYASNRPDGFFQSESEPELVQYLVENEDAISFFSYSLYARNDDKVSAAKILNDNDEYIEPLQTSIQDGSYAPLSWRIYMNVRKDPGSLAMAVPYLEMGLSDMGTELMQFSGHLPIPESERMVMKARIRAATGVEKEHLECGPAGEIVSMAGSTTLYNLVRLLGGMYEIGCGVKVQVEGGGSRFGADRVCGGAGPPVDIGLMSREWYDDEGVQNGINVQCNDWDTDRNLLQIPVASTGIVLVTASGGDAKKCVDILGGLTKDQLRWIYSSYNEKELEETGWDPSSLPNPDFDPQTHLWSELHSDCASTEILLTGPSDLTEDVYYDFMEEVFDDYDNGEEIATDRPNQYVSGESNSIAVSFLLENGAALGFFGTGFYKRNADALSPVPIQNSAGSFVLPHDSTIQTGSYDLLAKSLYMNVNNDVETLPSTIPLIRYALSDSGTKLVEAAGYVAIVQEKRDQFLASLCQIEGAPPSATFCGAPKQRSSNASNGAIVGVVTLLVAVVAVVSVYVVRKVRYGKEADSNDDANLSPYARSRTNWAEQEATVEEPVKDFKPKQNLHQDGNADDEGKVKESDTSEATPVWV
ncbi:PBP superfamily domain containing protein [Nitzschia inconspicua]|uniref:PBP superfamily domain containing protein n=1 Tax=Nitzschia inconspicua TaxID=303405 RepID=A0A9K3KGK8_9STRA|nr:PBP superfamily domain containing protein [Nitzschia inconspicua]